MSDPIIRVEELTRRFGGFTAVDGVDFGVERGEIFGYLGANGAGKTTTIRMLTGLLPPTSGEATIAGHEVTTEPTAVKRSIGYMSQRFSLYLDLTVEENLAFFASAYGLSGERRAERVAWAVERVGLEERRDEMAGSLPGGFRQRLALVAALMHEPAVVFLDEPTAGVDPGARRDFWRLIRLLARAGKTVFVTTHRLDEAEYCDRIGLMVEGRLVALDTPRRLKEAYVPETVFEVELPEEGRALRAALEGADEVIESQPFGTRLHVHVGGELGRVDRFQAFLADRGWGEVEPRVIEASLEDVFLRVAGNREGEA